MVLRRCEESISTNERVSTKAGTKELSGAARSSAFNVQTHFLSLNATLVLVRFISPPASHPAGTVSLQSHANGPKVLGSPRGLLVALNGWNDSGNYPVMTQQLNRGI